MENFVKQIRVRFSGVGLDNTEEPGSIKDRRIPPQKTQSFKGEKKRGQNWFQRQFYWPMSQDYNSNNDMEYAMAVAAAAYAINSLQDSGVPDKKKTSEAPERSLTRLKSKKEDTTISMQEPGKNKQFSGQGSMKNLKGTDSMVPETTTTDVKAPEAAPASPIKKTPTFAGKQLNSAGSMKPKSEAPKPDVPTIKPGSTAPKPDLHTIEPQKAAPKPDMPPTIKPATPPIATKGQSSTRPGIGENKADTWEKAEMAMIKERYNKVNSTILDWENKKKAKAKRKLNRAENEGDQKRAKALQKFHSEMESIDQIAGGARAQAKERQRNEELKAKEKANIIRTTGKVPKPCFCF